jgi:acyl dehydratase
LAQFPVGVRIRKNPGPIRWRQQPTATRHNEIQVRVQAGIFAGCTVPSRSHAANGSYAVRANPNIALGDNELQQTPKYYWEDFKVGDTAPIGERVVDKDEVIAFGKAYDPQPFHVDEDAAKQSVFGGLIASGWHTVGMVMRMTVDSYLRDSASLGSPGVDSVRWLKPVHPGDTIRATRKVVETRASKSRPDMGVVKTQWEVFNQDGDLVMTMEGYGMFQRRDPGEPA